MYLKISIKTKQSLQKYLVYQLKYAFLKGKNCLLLFQQKSYNQKHFVDQFTRKWEEKKWNCFYLE